MLLGNRDYSATIRWRPSACCARSQAIDYLRRRALGRRSSWSTAACRPPDYAHQTLTEVPYRGWRDYDPEDSVRFFAFRLHETGFIKSTPSTVIADGTDWRFLNELKRELKA